MNVIVGKLENAPSKAMLLYVDNHKVTNNITIQQTILDACQRLWPGTNRGYKLVLLLSDQASYMVKAAEELKKSKVRFPRLSHVTCIVYAISLVCQSITKEFFLVSKLFGYEKKWFSKSN